MNLIASRKIHWEVSTSNSLCRDLVEINGPSTTKSMCGDPEDISTSRPSPGNLQSGNCVRYKRYTNYWVNNIGHGTHRTLQMAQLGIEKMSPHIVITQCPTVFLGRIFSKILYLFFLVFHIRKFL
jgi:hypothetical protein